VDAGAWHSLRGSLRGTLHTEEAPRAAASRDASFVVGAAEAVVRPADADDVVALVRWARQHRVPVTARGGGTSLDGESVPVAGGVVVDFSAWRTIEPVDPAARTVRVGPGVVNHDLHQALRPDRWFFPPNPGSWRSCTIGGNLATNASGPRSFRYGPTRRWVHAADVVLGSGETTTLGPTTAKRSVGPELLDLVVGSEGTLGLVTSVTLRLARSPARRCGVAVPIPASASVGTLARSLAANSSLPLAAVEYVDPRVADVLRARRGVHFPGSGALVLLELESEGEDSETASLEALDNALQGHRLVEPATVVPDADRLWTARGEAGAVLADATGPSVREDVAVPLAQIDALLARVAKIAKSAGVESHVYGHLGQGNLHPMFVVDPASEAGRNVRVAVLEAARALGGTVSGEHGVGAVKRGYVAAELGDVALGVLRGWKSLCDPDGILNPGKLLPDSERAAPSPGRLPSRAEGGRTPRE
jgi:D-lactate dehydrogenase